MNAICFGIRVSLHAQSATTIMLNSYRNEERATTMVRVISMSLIALCRLDCIVLVIWIRYRLPSLPICMCGSSMGLRLRYPLVASWSIKSLSSKNNKNAQPTQTFGNWFCIFHHMKKPNLRSREIYIACRVSSNVISIFTLRAIFPLLYRSRVD